MFLKFLYYKNFKNKFNELRFNQGYMKIQTLFFFKPKATTQKVKNIWKNKKTGCNSNE